MLAADTHQAELWHRTRDELRLKERTDQVVDLRHQAQSTRRSIIQMIDWAQAGHIGGDLSVTDILTVLFHGVLRLRPEDPQWSERDRFILSKGHCVAALYSTLASCGFFSSEELRRFMAPLSELNGHPNRQKVPGVETNTGPLGHGLPVAVGCAIGARLAGGDERTFVVVGDGELQEGSNWEAMMCASHQELDTLFLTVDRNRMQQGDMTESTNRLDPLSDRIASFGWEVREVDGHDHQALLDAYRPSTTGAPVAVIARTVKGKGVSFIEDRVEWHHKVPSQEQVVSALEELV